MKRFVNATFVLLILLVLGLMASCQKDPQPEPTPETPVTPVEPKNDTIFWDIATNSTFSPSAEVVREHLDKPNTKNVVIHLFKSTQMGGNGIGQPVNATYYKPAHFYKVRDDFTYMAFATDSTRVTLYVIFEVTNVNAPGHGWEITEPGITPDDKAWFERHGAQFIIVDGKKTKAPNHGFTSVLPRAITNGGKTR